MRALRVVTVGGARQPERVRVDTGPDESVPAAVSAAGPHRVRGSEYPPDGYGRKVIPADNRGHGFTARQAPQRSTSMGSLTGVLVSYLVLIMTPIITAPVTVRNPPGHGSRSDANRHPEHNTRGTCGHISAATTTNGRPAHAVNPPAPAK